MDVSLYLSRLLRPDVLLAVLGVYLAQLVAYKAYKIFIYPYYVSPLRQLPGPKNHHFLIGHILHQIRSGHPNEPYLSWMRQWPETPAGLIRYFDVANGDAVLVTSLAALKEILHEKCYSFQKPPFFKRLVADMVGYGLVFTEGEEHKKQRRLLAGLFSPANLRALVPLFRDKARHMSDMLDRVIEREGGVVDLVSLYSKIMLDIMGVFALGVELGNLQPANDAADNSFDHCYHELFEPDTRGQILMGINTVVPVRWLPLEANRRFKQALQTVRSQLMAIIQDRIRTVGEWKAAGVDSEAYKGKDLLTFMVAEKYYTDNDRWSQEYIMEQILTFLAAGHETTASGLTWGTQLMIEHPDSVKLLRTEIDALLRREPAPDQRSIESLPYLHNFTREVLRLQAPGITVAREVAPDRDVVIQGVVLPRGTTVMIQPAIFNHNPTIWGPDCDEFRPDRWDRLEGGPAEDPWAFATFPLGPRVCIGKAMTLLEFNMIFVELVSKFDIEGVVPGANVGNIKHINPSPLLRPEGGLKVRVRRRVE